MTELKPASPRLKGQAQDIAEAVAQFYNTCTALMELTDDDDPKTLQVLVSNLTVNYLTDLLNELKSSRPGY